MDNWQITADFFKAYAETLSLVLILFGLLYESGHRASERRRNIDDEFWLRQVIFPEVALPIVKWLSECAIECANMALPTSNETAEKFYLNFQDKQLHFTVRLQILEAINPSLYEKTHQQLNDITDSVADFISFVDAGNKGKPPTAPFTDRNALHENLLKTVTEIVKSLRAHQSDF